MLAALGGVDDIPPSTLRDWRRSLAANHDALAAGAAVAAILYGAQLPNRDLGLAGLLIAVHQAALRRSDLIPAPLRILNILTGGSWLSIRVEPCWAGIGQIPSPAARPDQAIHGTSKASLEAEGTQPARPCQLPANRGTVSVRADELGHTALTSTATEPAIHQHAEQSSPKPAAPSS